MSDGRRACLQRAGKEGAAEGDGHGRQPAALGQQVGRGLPDGLDARAAGPPRIEGLLGLLQAEPAAPVHVRQRCGRRSAQACTARWEPSAGPLRACNSHAGKQWYAAYECRGHVVHRAEWMQDATGKSLLTVQCQAIDLLGTQSVANSPELSGDDNMMSCKRCTWSQPYVLASLVRRRGGTSRPLPAVQWM